MHTLHRRTFLAAAATAAFASTRRVCGANNDIRVAIIGVGGKGNQHRRMFSEIEGVRVTALCDPDAARLDKAAAEHPNPVEKHADLRRVLDDKNIDAVCIATCNHWHALAAVWACQAGKDVYVEKPVAYDLWEGRQLVAASRQYNRIVQGGTQRRSDEGWQAVREYLAKGELGKILRARVLHYSQRDGIGKRNVPLQLPDTVDYNLWAGPAPTEKLYREKFHYDWHWHWATGNGELGNNGPHSLDIARWMLGYDALAPGVISVGGRYAWDDAGETPNTQMVFYDYAPAPILAEVRNLPTKTGVKGSDTFMGTRTGVIIECEGGHIAGLAGAVAYDPQGKKIQTFRGDNGRLHQSNFIDAVRSRKRETLKCEIADGHLSTGLCLMGNVSHRVGTTRPAHALKESLAANPMMNDAWGRMTEHLGANDVNLAKQPAVLGAALKLDPKTEQFIDTADAEAANRLSHRVYRAPFAMPESV